jgi:hypothetical protein
MSLYRLFSGKDGFVKVDDQIMAKVTNCSIDAEVSPLDTTGVGDLDGTVIPDVRRKQGSMTLHYWRPTVDTPAGTREPSTFVEALFGTSDPVDSCYVDLELSLGADQTFKQRVLITRVGIGTSVNETCKLPVSFVSDGPTTELVA